MSAQSVEQTNAFFATAKPLKLFLRVALPGMFSMLAMSIYSIIEGVFVGHLLGEAAFAAINIAMPFVLINFSLADLIGVGSSVPISIALGRKDNDKANNIFTCAIIMIFLAALSMGLVMFFASPALVKLMGASGEMATLAVKYVRVYAILGPVTTLVFAMDNFLRICGFVKGSMLLNIFMSLFTALLLFILLSVAKMNVEGSALATCLSMATCAIIALIPFLRGKTLLKFVKPRFSRAMVREIVSCGMPVFLNNISGRVAAILMNGALLRIGGEQYGQTAVAAYSVLMYAGWILEPLIYGMSDSVHPAIGYNWGRKSLDRVRDITKITFIACGLLSLVGTTLMFIFPRQLAVLFVDKSDVQLLTMATHAMRLFCLTYLFRWFSFVTQGFYSAIEKPLSASVISVSSAMVFPVIFIFALTPLGLDGLWLNMTATSFVVMILSLILLLRSQKRIKKDIETAN